MEQSYVQQRWLETPPDAWTTDLVRTLCNGIANDTWKIQASLVTRMGNAASQLALLDEALSALDRVSSRKFNPLQEHVADVTMLKEIFQSEEDTARSVMQRRELLELRDKTCTWQEVYGHPQQQKLSQQDKANDEGNLDESWQFDLEDDAGQIEHSLEYRPDTDKAATAVASLPNFLDTSILEAALREAAEGEMNNLTKIFLRHSACLSSHRMYILDHIPQFASIVDSMDLLPQVDTVQGVEHYQSGAPWRNTPDWAEHPNITVSLNGQKANNPPSAEEVTAWYQKMVAQADQLGQVDFALTVVQYGASQGVPGLDALGEELSLLSKLVYEAHSGLDAKHDDGITVNAYKDWTLAMWRSSSEKQIIEAYLNRSTAASLSNDTRRLVLPYLYVLESRLEREGRPDPSLHDRLLFDWIFDIASSRLDLVQAVCEASKPTLAYGQRLIKSDEVLARVALSCLYGFDGVSAWDTMSSIFDCLPAFSEERNQGDYEQNISHILGCLLSSSSPPTAKELHTQLLSLSVSSLSKALDSFDLHLEAAEIFERWSAPQPLRFFVVLSDDVQLQRTWANRLAKTSAAAVRSSQSKEVVKLGQDFEFEDEWISLLDDLCRLAGKDTYHGNEPKPAFASLTLVEIKEYFFGGLLSSGKFALARSLLNPSSGEKPLDQATEENLVLAASREFYDNADSGNLHQGNMKLAFDCLNVISTTPTIRKERDFIEATSRLASFRLLNVAGQPLSPIEIRLTQDRLSLISQLLSNNEDAYRHPDVVLDLVAKLGYRADVLAEARVLSMIADAALRADDATRAAAVCEKMTILVDQIRKGRDKGKASIAAELTWKTCFLIGKTATYTDNGKRKKLLGEALLLCPPSSILEVLVSWHSFDSPIMKGIESRPLAGGHPVAKNGLETPINMLHRPSTPSSISLPHSAETAARAALSAATAYLPFRSGSPEVDSRVPTTPRSINNREKHSPENKSPARNTDIVKEELSKRFTAGVSWLLGADDE